MSLKEINWKVRYRSARDDLLEDFYIPALEKSILYKRAAGFFSTNSLALAARGIVQLIQNKGKMQLVVSPNFSKEDIKALENGYKQKNEIVLDALDRELDLSVDDFIKSRLEAVSWMVAQDMLDIKVAYTLFDEEPTDGLYHEKVGIFVDKDNNHVTFSGSINESYNAYKRNFESFDVQTSWGGSESQQLAKIKIKEFDDLWNERTNNLEIMSLPIAIRDRLLSITPTQMPTIDPEFKSKQIFKRSEISIPASLQLRPHQEKAIDQWFANKGRGVLQHATGSGKTITALSIASKLYEKLKTLAVIVLCPQKHLVDQWSEEAKNFEFLPIKGYESSKDWIALLNRHIVNFNIKASKSFMLVTTNASFGMEKMQTLLGKLKGNVLIIGDEVHNLGSAYYHKNLIGNAMYRLGLSATPDRWYDQEGSQLIYNYFGKKLEPVYGIKDAIDDGFLCKYFYYPYIVEFTDNEAVEYHELSVMISRCKSFDKSDIETTNDNFLKSLLRKRAALIGSASNKLIMLKNILQQYKSTYLNLFYCGSGRVDGDERQIELVCQMLGNDPEIRMLIDRFTYVESSSTRQQLLNKLKTKALQGIVAIRCLDEGVDVPDIERAFILASSTNPRQFVQRRGRILRKSKENPDKIAEIHDFIVVPPDIDKMRSREASVFNIERKLIRRELMRFSEFAETAENGPQASASILEIKKAYNCLDI